MVRRESQGLMEVCSTDDGRSEQRERRMGVYDVVMGNPGRRGWLRVVVREARSRPRFVDGRQRVRYVSLFPWACCTGKPISSVEE